MGKKSKIILREGERLSYQDMVEVVVGQWIARQMPYYETETVHGEDYFVGDADYEIKIVRKRKNAKRQKKANT